MKVRTEEEKKEFWSNRQPKLGKTFNESIKLLHQWSIKHQRLQEKYWAYCDQHYLDSISRAYECHRNGVPFEWGPRGLTFEEYIEQYENS